MFSAVTSSSRRELLTSVYKSLRTRAVRRVVVTADDVQELLDRKGFTRNTTKRLSVVRSLLNETLFYPTGVFTPSTREVARSRQIQEWTL